MIMMGMMTGGDGAPGDAHPEVIGRARMAVPLPRIHQWGGCPDQGSLIRGMDDAPPSSHPGRGAIDAERRRRRSRPCRTGVAQPGSASPIDCGAIDCGAIDCGAISPIRCRARPDRPPCGGQGGRALRAGPRPSSHAGGAHGPSVMEGWHHHRRRGIGADVPRGMRVTGRRRTVRRRPAPRLFGWKGRPVGPPRAAPLHDPSSVTMGRDGAGAHGVPS